MHVKFLVFHSSLTVCSEMWKIFAGALQCLPHFFCGPASPCQDGLSLHRGCRCGEVSLTTSVSQKCALGSPKFRCSEGRSPNIGKKLLEMLPRAKPACRGAEGVWPLRLPITAGTSLSIHKSLYLTSLLVSHCAQLLTNIQLWCFDHFSNVGASMAD